jgi:hypothetical protein
LSISVNKSLRNGSVPDASARPRLPEVVWCLADGLIFAPEFSNMQLLKVRRKGILLTKVMAFAKGGRVCSAGRF